jgi:transposase InsO family protein
MGNTSDTVSMQEVHRVGWNEVKQTMSFREEILNLGTQEGVNIRELCRRFQVSPKTFYKWLNRSRAGTGLINQSRRPHQSPTRTESVIEDKVLAVRAKHPSWGARKIRRVLVNGGEMEFPTNSTIHRILHRNGKVDASESSKHRAWQRFEHEAPNQLWQMDFKGWFETSDQRRCNPLTILDDHSRYVVCLRACLDQRTETVKQQLTDTFRRYGLPQRMTMDNGAPWGNDLQHPYTPLTVWMLQLGIRISHSRPYHPQTQGKDERFHRTLDVDLLRWHRFADIAQVQTRFDEYRCIYNQQRPHQALGFEVPASRYRISTLMFPEHLPRIDYDAGDIVRKVQVKGYLHYRGQSYSVGKAFSGYPVALRPTTEDGIFHVFFCHQRIGQIDVHQN